MGRSDSGLLTFLSLLDMSRNGDKTCCLGALPLKCQWR